ncbi:NADP-dependent oxidoreductase [Sporichthya sp.]|uniref:NADP-dependent oxidoreductase n=1 Tax=Sporichthya sp. TaxID=65475 RepID=UPI00185700AE|nr:NADP-dependent oxidoreductase [Sporichthya sp.]MBA3742613.1 NADP-dependent oxidoreductase [Sporichthya sp.]
MDLVNNRKILLREHPAAEPDDSCFEIVTDRVPRVGPGQAVVRVRYLSVDPAQRIWMNPGGAYGFEATPGLPMLSLGVGEVVDSRNPRYPLGAWVGGKLCWQQYAVLTEADETWVLPEEADPVLSLGVLGMNGQTAYWGLFDIGKPVPGETVLISAAAGATGSLAGQLARIAGCRVVGLAGTAAKRDWLLELGFDAALDYRSPDLAKLLDEACPDGVNVFFDNTGGPALDLALTRLALGGRVVLCGAIASYNDNGKPVGPAAYRMLIRQRGVMQGFIVMDYADRYGEALTKLVGWVADGSLKHREDVVHGLDNAPEALRRVLRGDNEGKMVVAL